MRFACVYWMIACGTVYFYDLSDYKIEKRMTFVPKRVINLS